jgi:oxaloacetate decarboxylase gamma subunit
MIADGLKLMVLGMGTVFLFLTLMVVFMSIAAKALAPLAGMLEKAPEKPKRKPKSGNAGGEDKKLAAAAIAAVHMHRAKNKNSK